MASAEVPPAPSSLAISSFSNPGTSSIAAATSSVSSTSKKQEHLDAGRRKLQEYRKKKAEEKKGIERNRTAGFVSERPLPNTPEENSKTKREISSIPSNKEVLEDGSFIVPQEDGPKARFNAVTSDGSIIGENELLKDEPLKENNQEESSRDVKNSLEWLVDGTSRIIEEDNNLSAKLILESHNLQDASGDASGSVSSSAFKATGVNLPNKSVSSLSNPGEFANNRMAGFYNGDVQSKKRESTERVPESDALGSDLDVYPRDGYLAKGEPAFRKQGISPGVLSDLPLSNGEGDFNLRRAFGAPHRSFSTVSLSSSTVPAFSEQRGNMNLLPQNVRLGQELSQYQFATFSGESDKKFEDTGVSTEKQFSFLPSKHPSPFYLKDTKPLFLSKSSDNSFHGPVSSIASNLSIPVHATITAPQGETLTVPTSASEGDMLNGISTLKHGIGSPNQPGEIQGNSEKDDFAALEQHIEDLTQEKFSLQRALDAAKSLTETLAQENSALTEDFNSQGAVINQLQGDIDRQVEELNAQSLVLNSIMVERERAQQESNSAVERSQILAGEVIGLEEKVLKLRSNELKLERDLENLKSETDTCRRQLLTMEKDRQNLRSMLEALQEDKKLLQGQLRKKIVTSLDSQPSIAERQVAKESKDAFTSTGDLDDFQASIAIENKEQTSATEMTGSFQLFERTDDSFRVASSSTQGPDHLSLNSSPVLATLPVDHFRIINNIDMLITELETDKESLVKLLRKESKKASELEALNAELSKKLEMQTQRLELAFAQNLAHEATAMITDPNDEQQDSEFVDEGDEIVERVLGWIARLFPGGSSKRRTSKLL